MALFKHDRNMMEKAAIDLAVSWRIQYQSKPTWKIATTIT